MRRPSDQTMTTTAAETSTHPAFWKATFEQHGGVILGYLTSRLGRRDLAEDLLQETFVKAIRSGALRDASKVRPYLLSVAHRLVIDHARRRRPLLFSEMSADEAQAGMAADEAPTAEERVDRERVIERLEEAMSGLAEPLRVAFRAAVVDQRSYDEIAAENGWTRGQVRVNVHRARKRMIANLRDLLRVDHGETP